MFCFKELFPFSVVPFSKPIPKYGVAVWAWLCGRGCVGVAVWAWRRYLSPPAR